MSPLGGKLKAELEKLVSNNKALEDLLDIDQMKDIKNELEAKSFKWINIQNNKNWLFSRTCY